MRTRLDNYTFTAGTRQIATGIADLTIEDIRLIINETQKVVISSSMQKDHIVSIVGGVITYVESYVKVKKDGTMQTITIPTLADGDKLTIEIDRGSVPVFTEISSQEIADIVERVTSEEENQ